MLNTLLYYNLCSRKRALCGDGDALRALLEPRAGVAPIKTCSRVDDQSAIELGIAPPEPEGFVTVAQSPERRTPRRCGAVENQLRIEFKVSEARQRLRRGWSVLVETAPNLSPTPQRLT